MKGIDVSKWQGKIDWTKVRASGIGFAMIRVGTGSNRGAFKLDPCFKENITNALATGIKIGVYLYSYALSTEAAKAEAECVVKALEPYKDSITFPVAYDLEDSSQKSLGKATLTAMARAFCNTIRSAGYIPMLYASADWLKNYVDPSQVDADIWVAQWGSKPNISAEYAIWQHTNVGKVDGISGNVDMNVAYKEYTAIQEKGDEDMPRYIALSDVPEWGRDTVKKLVEHGVLKGDEKGSLNLSEDMVRMLVIMDRLGLTGGVRDAI